MLTFCRLLCLSVALRSFTNASPILRLDANETIIPPDGVPVSASSPISVAPSVSLPAQSALPITSVAGASGSGSIPSAPGPSVLSSIASIPGSAGSSIPSAPGASLPGQSASLTASLPGASGSGSIASATLTSSISVPSSSSNVTSSGNSTSSGDGIVIAHFMVGNAAPYTADNWASDITLASSKGLDGFVLNLGADSWMADQVSNAFNAAQSAKSPFRIGFSFDMTTMPCAAASDAALLQKYITTYSGHPNVLQFDGKMLVTTFSGEKCTFGQSSVDAGWASTVKGSGMPPVHFIASFFVDPGTLGSYQSLDGALNWNGGWPQSKVDASFDTDTSFISALGEKTYLAAVSPWFFTHYGPDSFNKNWIYNFDDWLFSTRWEALIQNRDKAPIVEVLTWNDYGESHYVGPIEGAQPNSQTWVDGFDHQGWLDIMQYYIGYYKTGTAPAISQDRIFLWAKLYPTAAVASDPIGPPRDADWASDTLWAQFHLTQPADLTLACGASTQTFPSVPAGVSKQKLALTGDCDMSAKITRGGADAVSFAPQGMNFSTSPPSYNFNAFVAASPTS